MLDNIYVQLTFILLSVILVLAILILYIVQQTLQLKKEYKEKLLKKNSENGMWIDRRQSETVNNDTITSKPCNGFTDTCPELMLTFKAENKPVEYDLPDFLPPPPPVPKKTISNDNEYSEYCVPDDQPLID